jgi:hypothetical protein
VLQPRTRINLGRDQRHCFRTDPIVLRLRPIATPRRLYLTQELIQPFWSKCELERRQRAGDANSGKSNEATFGITLEGIPGVRWSELDRHGVGIGIGFEAKGLRKWSDGKVGGGKRAGRRAVEPVFEARGGACLIMAPAPKSGDLYELPFSTACQGESSFGEWDTSGEAPVLRLPCADCRRVGCRPLAPEY